MITNENICRGENGTSHGTDQVPDLLPGSYLGPGDRGAEWNGSQTTCLKLYIYINKSKI